MVTTRSQRAAAAKRRRTNPAPAPKRSRPNRQTRSSRTTGNATQNDQQQPVQRRRSSRLRANREAVEAKQLEEEKLAKDAEPMQEEKVELVKTENYCRQHFSVLRNLGFSRKWMDYGSNILDQRTEEVLKSNYSVKRIKNMHPSGKIWTIEVSQSNALAFTGTRQSGHLGIWNFGDVDVSSVARLHSKRISDIILHPSSSNPYTVSLDGYVKLYDVDRNYDTAILQHEIPLHCGAFCEDINSLFFGDEQGNIIEVDSRLPRQHLFGKYYKISKKKCASIAINGMNLYAATNDCRIISFDLRFTGADFERYIDVFNPSKVQQSVNVSRDGTRLVVSGRDNHIRVFSNPSRDLQDVQKINHNNNTGIWISPFRPVFHPNNPNYVFSGELGDRVIGIYNFSSRKNNVSRFSMRDKKVGSVFSFAQFHEPSQRIISVTYGKVHMWTNS